VRVVLDTNVLVAAFATRGLCEDVLRTVLAEHELVISERILGELERVLREKLRMPAVRARAVTDFVRQTSMVVEPEAPSHWPERDIDDQWIVAAAILGHAQVLVSGDRDLQHPPSELPADILSPRDFWERLKQGGVPR
jgi:putative PIN family toxin of toxin-antitoxin system